MDKIILCEDCWEDDDLDFGSLVLNLHKPCIRGGLQRCQGCTWWGPVKEENGEPVIVVHENQVSAPWTTVLDWLTILAILAVSLILLGITGYKNGAQPENDLTQVKKVLLSDCYFLTCSLAADPQEPLGALATFSPIPGDSVLGLLDNAHLGIEETNAKLLLLPMCQLRPIQDRPSIVVMNHVDWNTSEEKGFVSRSISSGHPDSIDACSSGRHGNCAHGNRTYNVCKRIQVMCEWVSDFIHTIEEFFLPATVTLSD